MYQWRKKLIIAHLEVRIDFDGTQRAEAKAVAEVVAQRALLQRLLARVWEVTHATVVAQVRHVCCVSL